MNKQRRRKRIPASHLLLRYAGLCPHIAGTRGPCLSIRLNEGRAPHEKKNSFCCPFSTDIAPVRTQRRHDAKKCDLDGVPMLSLPMSAARSTAFLLLKKFTVGLCCAYTNKISLPPPCTSYSLEHIIVSGKDKAVCQVALCVRNRGKPKRAAEIFSRQVSISKVALFLLLPFLGMGTIFAGEQRLLRSS